jgi:FAD dependent oxidoreductase
MNSSIIGNKLFLWSSFFLSILSFSLFIWCEREVRFIHPPKLDDAHILKKVLCHRPMRHGSPNMSVERIGVKVVAHNYGHGGSGWTLGPGAVQYVNDLLENSPYQKLLHKNTPITIVGAGIIGLLTAYDLLRRGYTNITVVAAAFDDITSHKSGALFAPVSMDNKPEVQPLIDALAIASYRFYKNSIQGNNPIIPTKAVREMPAYFVDRNESGLEPYVGVVMETAKDVLIDFGNGTTHEMVVYDDGIYINPYFFMDALSRYLRSKITFIQKKIHSFAEIPDRFIMDCTGLGARELDADSAMVPVQGHLMLLRDQNPLDLEYMLIYHGYLKTKDGFLIKRALYIFPKQLLDAPEEDVGVLGGTFIVGATADAPHEEEFEIILHGARQFYGME